MKIKELITDPNGTLSHTKLWSNIGMATLTVAFIIGTYRHGITPELIVAYGGIVVFGRATSKYLDNKTVSTGE
ncbi:MAG: hypothetical protein IE909_17815 [Campylobacterales bacterium]|nr:hypothetical protein [Campylobacterales bacterium]